MAWASNRQCGFLINGLGLPIGGLGLLIGGLGLLINGLWRLVSQRVGLKWFFLLVCFWQFSRGCSCYGLWVWWWWQSTWIDGGFLFNFLFWDCCDLLGKGFGFIVAVIGFVLWVIVTGQRMDK